MGSVFMGDAVLALKDTPCENLIMIGSCGAVISKNIDIGSIVCPTIAYPFESFSSLLKGDFPSRGHSPSKALLNKWKREYKLANTFYYLPCASMGSILLEQQSHSKLIKNKVAVVDLECATFFAASHYIGRKAISVLHVTDILNKSSAYSYPNASNQKKIQKAQMQTLNLLKTFVANL
jgi:purine-nucleoside phosphorylase